MRDLSLHLMDIVQNSVKASADYIRVTIEADLPEDILSIEIFDTGKGMDEAAVARVRDPFVTSRTTRKVGMGIPMFDESAKAAGGNLEIHSVLHKGTTIKGTFGIRHIDRLPLGDVALTMATLVMSSPDIRYILILKNCQDTFTLDTDEIKKAIGEVPIESIEVIEWIQGYIAQGIQTIFGGILNEIDSGS